MSETIAQDLVVQGGQLIVGGDKVPLRLVGLGNCILPPGGGIPGAASYQWTTHGWSKRTICRSDFPRNFDDFKG